MLEINYDRLGWLATARAAKLLGESDLSKTHYAAHVRVTGEGGQAAADALFGGDLCDTMGKVMGHRQFTPYEMGLANEIDCFLPAGPDDANERDTENFMERTYVFDLVPNNKPNFGCIPVVMIVITLVKRTRTEDWDIALEFLRDCSREGDKQMIIFREGGNTVAKDGRVLN